MCLGVCLSPGCRIPALDLEAPALLWIHTDGPAFEGSEVVLPVLLLSYGSENGCSRLPLLVCVKVLLVWVSRDGCGRGRGVAMAAVARSHGQLCHLPPALRPPHQPLQRLQVSLTPQKKKTSRAVTPTWLFYLADTRWGCRTRRGAVFLLVPSAWRETEPRGSQSPR